MRQLSAELGVSEHRLTTALRKHGIPPAQAGYWSKLPAGKRVQAAEADRIDPVLSGQVDEHLIAKPPGSSG